MEEMSGSLAFGDVLRRYRLAAGLTQEALAERAGLSVRAITDLERGINRSPRQETFARLTAAFELSAADRALWEAARRRSRTPSAQLRAGGVSAEKIPPFVGREQELRLLEFHLITTGAPLLLLAGEPGIGKSRLLREALPAAVGYGLCVLSGGCTQRGGQEPYAPLAPALARHLRQAPPERARMALRGCAWLVHLLPELSERPVEPLPSVALPVEQERRLMFEAVVRFLRNVAGARGTLLLLDNLQWAGEDALNLLRTLAHAAGESNLRIVGAYRDTEVGPQSPLSVMLADLAQAGLAQQRHIGPLAPQDTHRLVHSLLHTDADTVLAPEHRDAVADQLLGRANGVPFFLVSCAQSVRANSLEHGAAAELPWTVAQSIRQRVAALPDATRELLGTAAIIGREVSRATLAAATSRIEEEVLMVIEPACHARLLEEAGVDGYRFVHDVIREVVAADLGTGRRALMHRRVADVLAGRVAPPLEAVAYHYREAGAWDSALPYLLQAGDQAAHAYAYAEALELYAQAEAVCARLGDGALPTAVTTAQKRGTINLNRMALGQARVDYERMAALGRQLGDRRQESMALMQRGMAAWMDHAFAEAEATYRSALAISGPDVEDVRVAATLGLAHLCQSLNRPDEARELFQEAAASIERVDDPFIHTLDGHFRAFPLIWGGHFNEALAILARCRPAAEQTGQEILRLQQKWIEALSSGGKGAYEHALALLEEVLAAGERCGDVLWKGRCLNTMGWVYAEIQDHPRALELNRLAFEAAQELKIPDPEVENNTRLNLGDSLVALGRLDEAAAQYQMVQRVVERPAPEEQWLLWRYAQHLFHSFGELQLLRGDHATALANADACLRLAEQSVSRKNIVKARRLRGQVFVAQRRLPQAEQELANALELAEEVGNPPQLWKTYVAIGELRQVQGRMADRVAAYRAAMKVIEGIASDLRDLRRREILLGSPQVAAVRRHTGID